MLRERGYRGYSVTIYLWQILKLHVLDLLRKKVDTFVLNWFEFVVSVCRYICHRQCECQVSYVTFYRLAILPYQSTLPLVRNTWPYTPPLTVIWTDRGGVPYPSK